MSINFMIALISGRERAGKKYPQHKRRPSLKDQLYIPKRSLKPTVHSGVMALGRNLRSCLQNKVDFDTPSCVEAVFFTFDQLVRPA